MARFSLAHAGEPISVADRQLYLDPARAIKQAFLPSGVHGVAERLECFTSFGWVDGGKTTLNGGCGRFCCFSMRGEAAAKMSEQRFQRLYASPLSEERSCKIHTIEDEKNRGASGNASAGSSSFGPGCLLLHQYSLGRDSAAKTRAAQ